mgnify:CR=1 FL=1
MEISIESKENAFLRKEQVFSKTSINNQILEQVEHFNYLGYQINMKKEMISMKKDIKFNRSMRVINQVFNQLWYRRHPT